MLKSSNINSVLNELPEHGGRDPSAQTSSSNGKAKQEAETCCSSKDQEVMGSLAALQLSAGVLQIAEPPLDHVRVQLRELIGRQNKIYIDLSKEKYKLDCSEVAKLNDMGHFEEHKILQQLEQLSVGRNLISKRRGEWSVNTILSRAAKQRDKMSDVRRYKDKLAKIKKEMQGIYQRTKDLKKRAANVAACKQRDYQRKLDRQQHEESLIGGH